MLHRNPVGRIACCSYRASGLEAMGCAARQWHHRRGNKAMECPMAKQNDLSRCLVTLEQDATVIAVIEIGQSSWLVAGIVPGLERNPLKKLSPDQDALLPASLAEGSGAGWTHDQTDRRRL
jgi:transposase